MWENNKKALRTLNDAAVKCMAFSATEHIVTLKLAVGVDESNSIRPVVVLEADPMTPEEVLSLLLRAADDYERMTRGGELRGKEEKEEA